MWGLQRFSSPVCWLTGVLQNFTSNKVQQVECHTQTFSMAQPCKAANLVFSHGSWMI